MYPRVDDDMMASLGTAAQAAEVHANDKTSVSSATTVVKVLAKVSFLKTGAVGKAGEGRDDCATGTVLIFRRSDNAVS
jgi:hypothetical protein